MLKNDLPAFEDLDRRVATFLDESGEAFSGAYLVAIDGALRIRGARGLANREFEVPNQPSTRFRIGSITKQLDIVNYDVRLRDNYDGRSTGVIVAVNWL